MEKPETCVNTDPDLIELWSEMSAQGEDIPIVLSIRGVSMRPLVNAAKDNFVVKPLRRDLILGDIIIFRRSDGQYVAHRVCKITDAYIQTWGDNCKLPDQQITMADVRGLVSHIRRGKRMLCVDTPFWRFFGRVWMKIYPFRMFCYEYIKVPLWKMTKGRKTK